MIPPILQAIFATIVIVCNLTMPPEPWEPEPADVEYISRTIWGEARGCDEEQRAAVAWCILGRVSDDRFPDSIQGVVTQPHQFQGYSPNFPADTFYDEAKEIIIRWHNGEWGMDPDMLWFYGDGQINHFRNAWRSADSTKSWP